MRTINRLDRAQMRRLEDFLLTHKEAIESGSLNLSDLVRLSTEKLSITPSEHTVDSCLTTMSINRPRSKTGGLQPIIAKMEALEARLAAVEEALTHPPKAGQHPRR